MKKKGIPYFPLDVELDEKFQLIEAEFGLKGWAVVVKLFQKIYGEDGYFCLFTTDVGLLFAQEIGVGYSFVKEITKASIQRGIFDKTMFQKYHILTSKGIQKRYFKVVSRRERVEIDERYLIISVDNFSKIACRNEENVNSFSKIACRNAGSIKYKYIFKRKESVREKRKDEEDFLNTHTNIIVDNDCDTSNVDFAILSEEINKSKWLQQATSFSFLCGQFEKIKSGYYRDIICNKGEETSRDFANEHKYSQKEFDSLIDDVASIEF